MNQGLQNQDVLYTSDSHEMTADSKVFFDPNTLSPDGTTALGGMSFTDAGAQLRSLPHSLELCTSDTACGHPPCVRAKSRHLRQRHACCSMRKLNRRVHGGDMVAYMLADSGSDWKTIKVMSVAADGSTQDRPGDTCTLVRFSCLTWTLDGCGFFYCKCAPRVSRRAALARHGAMRNNVISLCSRMTQLCQ